MSQLAKDFFAIKAISGFTLIELMVSLVLGLLISAIVVQVYMTNVHTSTAQKGAGELQDASVFGLQMLESHIRLANMGNPLHQINDSTPNGGIVLSPLNLNLTNTTFPTSDYLTHSAEDNKHSDNQGWKGVSNTNKPSDQLTLQFTNITGADMADCEGNTIANGVTVIERYFLRATPASVSTKGNTTEVQNLALACDAGRITHPDIGADSSVGFTPVVLGGNDPKNFGQAGQEFIANADQFNILLGVQSVVGNRAGTIAYVSPHDYMAISSTKPAIVSVKIGLIVHGSMPVIGMADSMEFSVLGVNNRLKNDPNRKKQVRTSYETTSLLRNARVITVSMASSGGSSSYMY